MYKNIILSALIALVALAAPLFAKAAEQTFEYQGQLVHDSKSAKLSFIPSDSPDREYRLLLAPQAVLDSLGIEPGMLNGPVQLNGKIAGSALIVRNLLLGESLFQLRVADDSQLWTIESAYHVNPRECIGCRLCPSKCPVGAITMVKGKAVIDQDKCTECGICREGIDTFRGCPVGAIKTK